MKTVVLTKQVPDTYGGRKLRLDDGTLERTGSDAVTDEVCERALEVALQIRQASGGDITVLTMGPGQAVKSLRKCLAMGGDKAVHIVDDRLAGSDVRQTAVALAAALRTIEFDLVIAGDESTDGRSGSVPSMLAELLGLPQLTHLRSVEVNAGGVVGERITEDGYVAVHAPLPALISVTEQVAEPRYPNLKGILGARKKPIVSLSVADLGLIDSEVGGKNSWSAVQTVTTRPPRTAGRIITDDGTAGTQIIEYLASAKLI